MTAFEAWHTNSHLSWIYLTIWEASGRKVSCQESCRSHADASIRNSFFQRKEQAQTWDPWLSILEMTEMCMCHITLDKTTQDLKPPLLQKGFLAARYRLPEPFQACSGYSTPEIKPRTIPGLISHGHDEWLKNILIIPEPEEPRLSAKGKFWNCILICSSTVRVGWKVSGKS